MTLKIKLGILALTSSILLILMVYIASAATGFSLPAPMRLYTTALAQTINPPSPGPLILTDEQGNYPLGLHMDLLEDPRGGLTIDQVSSQEYVTQFIPSHEDVPNYGFTGSAYWVRLRLDNRTRSIDEWLLELGWANMHFVDLYSPLPGGAGYSVKQTGLVRPAATRDVRYPRIIFTLSIPPGSQQTYYLRFQNGASMTLSLTLWAQNVFFNHALVEQMFMALFFGVLIGLLFYHLFLLYSFREANYLYFVIVLASMILEEAVFEGYWVVYGFPNFPIPIQKIQSFVYWLVIASVVLFSDTFLELKKQHPKLHLVNLVILTIGGILLLLIPFTSYHIIANPMAIWGLISLTAVLVAGLASWSGGFKSARFFMLAWIGLLAGVLWLLLIRLGLLSSTFLSENLYRLGFMWLAVSWAIALADRINLLKADVERANRDLHTSEQQLSQILDGLPLGVVLYGKDQKPKYANRRTVEILSSPSQGVQPDLSAERTLAQSIQFFSLKVSGSDQEYPIENIPVYSALQGEPAAADDIEVDQGDRRVPLEIWASPIRDDAGNVESAVVAFQDITERKHSEAELLEYRQQLEALVVKRTAELNAANEQLQVRLEWLSAVNLVNQITAHSADFTQIYVNIMDIINNLFGTAGSFIAELSMGSNQFSILAHSDREKSNPDLIDTFMLLPGNFYSAVDPEQQNPYDLSGDQLRSISGPLGIHIQDTKINHIVLVPLVLREQVLGLLGLEMLDEGRLITSEESDLLRIFSIDIAQLIEDSRLFEQSKALIAAEERNHLARDLHDSVTQVLFSASLIAELLPLRIRRDPELALQSAAELRRLTRGALAEMRTLLLELRPAAIMKTPLGELLTQLTEAITCRTELPFQLYIDNLPPLPSDAQTTFYRIAQEALNNVVKHAEARQVFVSLSATPAISTRSAEGWEGEIRLNVTDDGIGFSPGDQNMEHMGIGIMRERAATINAIFNIESQPGQGTMVTLIWHHGNQDHRGDSENR